MGRLIELHDVNEFSRVARIPDAAITPEILAAVEQLHEIHELERFLREILYDPTETHHGPTEIADILTTHTHVRGCKTLSAFVLKGKSFRKVGSRQVSHQFMKLRTISGLGLVVFGAVGHIQDDAVRDCCQSARDANCDFLILNQHQIARLLIAYEKLCPKDGKTFDEQGQCPNGHCLDAGIPLEMTASEKIRYTIARQRDTSHAGAKRYSATIVLDRHYPRELIKEIIADITRSVAKSTYYRSDLTRARWGNRPAHVVYLFVGCDLEDINNCNWICRSSWIDPNLDQAMRPVALEGDDRVEDIDIAWSPQYEAIKVFTDDKRLDKGQYLRIVNDIQLPLVTLGQSAIDVFGRYLRGDLTEKELIVQMQGNQADVDDLYHRSNDIPFAPADCKAFDHACQNLFATIHDMFLYYSDRGLDCWSKQDREQLMRDTVSRFEENLLAVKFEEKKIH